MVGSNQIPTQSRVIVLIGPKGSGKTTIGRILEQNPRVHFLEVELIAKQILAERGGVIDEEYASQVFSEIRTALDLVARDHDTVVIETTGASEHTPEFLQSLRRQYDSKFVRVHSDAQTRARQIAERDSSRQVAVPEDLIRQMHLRTQALELEWDLELENDPPLTKRQVLDGFSPLFQSPVAEGTAP